jgi:hypothetical protein
MIVKGNTTANSMSLLHYVNKSKLNEFVMTVICSICVTEQQH